MEHFYIGVTATKFRSYSQISVYNNFVIYIFPGDQDINKLSCFVSVNTIQKSTLQFACLSLKP